MRLAPTFHHMPRPLAPQPPMGAAIAPGRAAAAPTSMTPPAGRCANALPATALPAKTQSVPRRVLHGWKSQFRVRVADRELRAGLNTLHLYHHDRAFFSDRFDGQRLVQDLGESADLELLLAPNRKSGMEADGTPPCGCPFCVEQAPVQRALNWRGWRVIANRYPYAPAHSQHTVLAAEGHKEQSCSAAILSDMLAYQHFVDDGRGVTMHYNGTAGNSQKHLHWHSSEERLPIERWLDAGDVQRTTLRKGTDGDICSYSHRAFSGLLVEGSAAYVARWGARLTARLDDDERTGGRYNLILLPQKDGRARLVIVARRTPTEDMPELGGAWAVVGRDVQYEDDVPENYAADLETAAFAHTVRPEELEWLAPLVRQPEHNVLFLRCA